MPSDLIARYQAKLDREFPQGAVASWEDRGNTATYLIPRVLVTGQQGLDPEIWLPAFAGSTKTLGPFRVLSYQPVQSHPYAVRVTLDNVDRPLLLNAGVSEEAARAMAGDRQRFTDLAPAGGARVFDGDAPE
jgi:hypothetical protein